MNEIEKLSDDPGENLQIENELLKLEMRAEFGANFDFQKQNDIDPQIENEFLKYIQRFERAYANSKKITVFEKLGQPLFAPADSIDPKDLKRAISRLMEMLESKNICIDFCDGPYPDEEVYRFVTEELMQQEIGDMQIESLMTHFIYEEFHPNHRAEIQRHTAEFMSCWIERIFNNSRPSLSKILLSPTGNRFTEEEFYAKLNIFFDAFNRFELEHYSIDHIEFELVDKEENLTGLGFSEGWINYKGILENGEWVHYEGGFKIYFSQRWNWWSINSFWMPGFMWNENDEPA